MVRIALLLLIGAAAACDGGLKPPDEIEPGSIYGTLAYKMDSWPPYDSLVDLRFVAMRFVPQDTADFLQLNRLVFSQGLNRYVERDTFLIPDVQPGTFVYSGVAQQFGRGLFQWRPVALYEEQGGVFVVQAGRQTNLHLYVDFRTLPPFPPSNTP